MEKLKTKSLKKAQALIITIAIIVLILIGIGFYYFSTMNSRVTGGVSQTDSENNQVNTPTTNTPTIPQTNSGSEGKTYNVNIQNFAFNPSSLTISAGDTIVWTNMDSAMHTVTSDSGTELNSALLSQGQTYSHTFTQTGIYDYHCTPHLNMKGKIIVE